jgi:hypothetical protein
MTISIPEKYPSKTATGVMLVIKKLKKVMNLI